MSSRRLLLVHAHPDDETIGTGITMAKYVSENAKVTLVTCTSGEEGEVLVPELANLASSADDKLGPHRQIELANAMKEIGVTDHRFLGGPGKFRDSGMIGTPPNERKDSFWQTDLQIAADELVKIIREVKPQVLITYDDFGGYGHPDHIQAHRIAHYATDLANVKSYKPELGNTWEVSKIYWTAIPKSQMQKGIEALANSGGSKFFGAESADDLPFVLDDKYVTTKIDGANLVRKKLEALKCHATQVQDTGPFFQMAELIGPEALGVEYYRLVKGKLVNEAELETDLFAGLNVE
jgi:N-acetyl-1-D-myo-inositol-2-amino-2-deoxy-alpha-D-glucopyranoside deacetylase